MRSYEPLTQFKELTQRTFFIQRNIYTVYLTKLGHIPADAVKATNLLSFPNKKYADTVLLSQ